MSYIFIRIIDLFPNHKTTFKFLDTCCLVALTTMGFFLVGRRVDVHRKRISKLCLDDMHACELKVSKNFIYQHQQNFNLVAKNIIIKLLLFLESINSFITEAVDLYKPVYMTTTAVIKELSTKFILERKLETRLFSLSFTITRRFTELLMVFSTNQTTWLLTWCHAETASTNNIYSKTFLNLAAVMQRKLSIKEGHTHDNSQNLH